jgi:exonuclease SbcD
MKESLGEHIYRFMRYQRALALWYTHPMRVLATSDIHLGRKPTHRPSSLEGWAAVVACAKEQAVDVVVLAGDIIEHERAWMGIYGPLVEGLKELAQASIKVIAVAGNHDWQIFPRLVKEEENIVVLGSDGSWETYEHKGVRFVGRSFASSHDRKNPFERFDAKIFDKNLLTVGILHTDVAVSSSDYAPTIANDYLHSGIDLWVLGHIHKPGFVSENKAFYCGSPFALDPAERGAHGVYILETEGTLGFKEPLFIPLSPVRYEQLQVPITADQDTRAIQEVLTAQIRTFATETDHEGDLYLDLLFTGSRNDAVVLDEVVGTTDQEGYFLEVGRTKVFVRKSDDATTLPLDLESLATSGGIDGILARLITEEKAIGEVYHQLDQESYNTQGFRALTQEQLQPEQIQEHARRSALRLLEAMVRQREEG